MVISVQLVPFHLIVECRSKSSRPPPGPVPSSETHDYHEGDEWYCDSDVSAKQLSSGQELKLRDVED